MDNYGNGDISTIQNMTQTSENTNDPQQEELWKLGIAENGGFHNS